MAETTDPADGGGLGALAALLRPELAELQAYAPPERAGIELKLDANEAPPPSPAVREAVQRAVASVALERYPDPHARRLKDAIARRTGARASDLLVGAGSDEVIALIVNALAQPRRRNTQAIVLTPTPTFVMYKITARGHGVKPVEVPLDAGWDLDVQMMRRAMQIMEPSVVFVASPNNPTGNRMSGDRVEQVIRHAGKVGGLGAVGEAPAGGSAGSAADAGGTTMVSARVSARTSGEPEAPRDAAFVVVDEAYVDYAGPGASVRELRARYPHMGVLRTVSKLGLAALRVGWLEADEALVRELDKARQPFNLSAVSQAAAAAVLEDAWDDLQAGAARVAAARDELASAIAALPGFDVTPSAANFVWVRPPIPAADAFEALARDGILVRSFHGGGGRLARQLRITVGTSAQNERLLASLTKVRA